MKNDITARDLSLELVKSDLRRIDLYAFRGKSAALIQNAYLLHGAFASKQFSRVWPRENVGKDEYRQYQRGLGLQGIAHYLWSRGFPIKANDFAALLELEFGYKIEVHEPNKDLAHSLGLNLLMMIETAGKKVSILVDTDASHDMRNYALTVCLVGLASEVATDRKLSQERIHGLLSDLAGAEDVSTIAGLQRRTRRELAIAILAPATEEFRSFAEAQADQDIGIPRSILNAAKWTTTTGQHEALLRSPGQSVRGEDDYRSQLVSDAGGALLAHEVAASLDMDVDEVERLSAERKLFSVTWRGSERFPRFQLDLIREGHGSELEKVVKSLDPRSAWVVLEFFLRPDSALGSISPLDALKAERKDLVERLLRQYEDDGYA